MSEKLNLIKASVFVSPVLGTYFLQWENGEGIKEEISVELEKGEIFKFPPNSKYHKSRLLK